MAKTALAIRKFTSRSFTIDDLIQRGTISHSLAEFLGEQIFNGKTLLISGGTGTGKTTLLRILADFIPDYERIVVIEDTPELHIRKPNIVAAGSQTNTFKSHVSFDDLLKDALRFRPDRIILGEVRGVEARTLLDSFIQVIPDRWLQFTRTPPRKPFVALQISSCAVTRRRPSPIPKQKSQRP